MKKRNLWLSLAASAFVAISTQPLSAVTITTGNLGMLVGASTTTGTLANQGVALEETFSLGTASKLTIYTSSYGGGKNADGSTAMSGGFMPSLTLYSSTGSYVAGETFPSPIGKVDAGTSLVGDAYLSDASLAPGTYILALSDFLVQQSASATKLSDGFINYGGGTSFSDVQGNPRTGNYSLSFTATPLVTPTPTPEPATFFLVIPALIGVVALNRRRLLVS